MIIYILIIFLVNVSLRYKKNHLFFFLSSLDSVEQLCQILVLSDQLLIERLKQICEFHIANLVTFRDATELLQFSVTYNAQQLRAFVEQFICRNMATFLEARLLENLDNQLLNDLSKSYRRLVRTKI